MASGICLEPTLGAFSLFFPINPCVYDQPGFASHLTQPYRTYCALPVRQNGNQIYDMCDLGERGSQEQWNINGMIDHTNFIYTKKHFLVQIDEGNP